MGRIAVNSAAIFIAFLFFISPFATADTVNTRDGRELKGVVVEEYKDRFVLSTIDGEITIMKSNVAGLQLDEAEDNLVMLAEKAREGREYGKSVDYYEKALAINPDSGMAKDGLAFVKIQSLQKGESKKRLDLTMMEDIDSNKSYPFAAKQEGPRPKEAGEERKGLMGMSLKIADYFPEVESVANDSPASAAGIRKGDRIVSIWGRLTRYLSLGEVADLLLSKGAGEIKCVVERKVKIPVSHDLFAFSSFDLIGLSLVMRFDGLTVSDVKRGSFAEKAGLEKDDLVVAIGGMSTRYMPLRQAVSKIYHSKKNESLEVTFRINTVIWKEAVR